MEDRNTDDGFYARWMSENERLQGMLKTVSVNGGSRRAMGEAGVLLGLAEQYIAYLRQKVAKLEAELGTGMES